jgi:hypothetical protein
VYPLEICPKIMTPTPYGDFGKKKPTEFSTLHINGIAKRVFQNL